MIVAPLNTGITTLYRLAAIAATNGVLAALSNGDVVRYH